MIVEMDLQVLARFIASIMGSHCEVVVHDLRDLANSVICIENGYITGREVGSPATDLALKKIREISEGCKEPYLLNYHGRAKNGAELRSSTLMLCKDDQAQYMLCVNIDDSQIKTAIHAIKALMPAYDLECGGETFLNSIADVSNSIIDNALCKLAITDIHRLNPEEKISFVREIDSAGFFSVKGNVQKIAKMLSISDQTLYRYLK